MNYQDLANLVFPDVKDIFPPVVLPKAYSPIEVTLLGIVKHLRLSFA